MKKATTTLPKIGFFLRCFDWIYGYWSPKESRYVLRIRDFPYNPILRMGLRSTINPKPIREVNLDSKWERMAGSDPAGKGGHFFNPWIHPGRLTWNIQITHLERKMIFQTPMIMFHVNLPGCKHKSLSGLWWPSKRSRKRWTFEAGDWWRLETGEGWSRQNFGEKGGGTLKTSKLYTYVIVCKWWWWWWWWIISYNPFWIRDMVWTLGNFL